MSDVIVKGVPVVLSVAVTLKEAILLASMFAIVVTAPVELLIANLSPPVAKLYT